MEKNRCWGCSGSLDKGYQEITVTGYEPAGMSFKGHTKTVTLCVNPACNFRFLSKLREEVEKRVKKTKTNKIGPAAPGFPGCAYNED